MKYCLKWVIVSFIMVGWLGCAMHHVRTANDLVRYGVELAEKGYWKEAVYHWEQALKTDPNHVAALNNVAVAYEVDQNPELAEKVLKKALSLRPDSQVIQKNLAALGQREHDELTRVEDDPPKKGFRRGRKNR
jgi:tetratricopeptide (TPR) repeat protein